MRVSASRQAGKVPRAKINFDDFRVYWDLSHYSELPTLTIRKGAQRASSIQFPGQ
jgi:hypothetical protein